jgi:CheY-like chemotaxis protein
MSAADDRRVRILLVEDDARNRALLRAVVSRADDPRLRAAELAEAPTLAAAREALARSTPDLVILDMRLPDGRGHDLARDLAARDADRPRVLIMSASVLPEERDAAIAAGCDAFLAKPFHAPELLEVLTRLTAP